MRNYADDLKWLHTHAPDASEYIECVGTVIVLQQLLKRAEGVLVTGSDKQQHDLRKEIREALE